MSFRIRHSIVVLAASTALAGGAVLGQAQAPAAQPEGQPAGQPGAQPAGQPGAQPAGRSASPAGSGAADAQAVDQQVQAQMRQIQQSPQGALDKLFVLGAGMGNTFEIAYAQQAMQKSQDPQVKQLAQTLIRDHQQASQQLMPVAQALGVNLPQGLDSMHAQKLQTYAALDAKDYDKKFICHNNEIHAKDIEAFKTAAATAMNPQVKQFAAAVLPKLQQHHQMIRQIGTGMGVVQEGQAMPAGARMPGDRPADDAAGKAGTAQPGAGNTRPPTDAAPGTNAGPEQRQ